MMIWSSREAENASKGFSTQNWQATGLAVDPLKVKPGDLYLHLPNQTAEALTIAFGKGAAAAVVSIWPEGMELTHPLLIVDDPLSALHRLAVAGLKRCGARRIAVTGPAAREGLAEMVVASLQTLGQSYTVSVGPEGRDGLMLALARIPAGTDYLVFDMDEEYQDDIKCDIILQAVRSFEKLEHVTLQACLEAANGTRLRAEIDGEEVMVTIPLPGQQVSIHALQALAVLKQLGGNLERGAAALAKALKRKECAPGQGPVTLMEDARSVSCARAGNAFKVLAMVDPGRGRKRIAILSHLHGTDGRAGNLDFPMQTEDVQFVYTKSPLLGRPANKRISYQKIVPDVLAPGDVLMLKGANGDGHGIVVEALRVPQG